MAETGLLEIENLHAWYGASHVLHGISLQVKEGEVVALVGRNGAGKTTTLRAMMGLMPKATGRVRFAGGELLPLRAHQRFHLGLAYVPEERRIVPGLSVRENLRLGLVAAGSEIDERTAIDEIAETFPRLKERLDQEGVTLSGGEQQMLAIARALIARPRMVLLDEPSEGIMPVLVEEMGVLFRRLRDEGKTLLLVEQNVEWALRLADRAVIIDQGEVVHQSSAAALLADKDIQERYCAV
ncbi:ABC transporter ATP-binding protein [Bradyrhizobium diazoefficiens]|jgi:branched-chain amino acid transport system ATP-binding protein|uniref:Putative ABC transporter ATP-binding protein n=1 Tax=Bradyrhizobium diazoefficiens SEMIA 5080 TaxID=754504 RepID=A0A837CCE7_9BRAD|nr:ABC transporter ATP-binding protein [Bradyrhizobium diazoefficiens]APO51473.1 ABC transporter ATP-binding protein [Bradyrhizobium diazoefficiens]KGJ66695.1 putative ABC transporter ATP-binding protein [Bradyrhizobium diazoefficiens SEMIA 5080]KOY06332.1 ABC transporter ATP-binding protein [Bradyrhizobium diazoefficiens]MCD9293182.1 ABC transporter ATP-binding protein [Bradyrhizobium diazoefficiens]MCD9812356.1 ABC transporter ATP-binding protein [Bradyrhizobium diazoefficiens]